jgi:diguanylate cyclase (GGDEF)-like protein/PAS domain S-box-containing protein
MYRQSQKNNLTLLSTSRDAISYVHDGMHIHANPSYLDMFGVKNMEYLEGLPVMDLVALEHHSKFKEFMRDYMTDENEEDRDIQLIGLRVQKNKRIKFKLKMEVSQDLYDNEKCIQIIIREESNNKELERKLKEINKLDQLTGLYNRQHFVLLLDKALSKAMENRVRSVVIYLSLDNYREIRDRVGIGGSDPIIANTAKALEAIKGDLVLARFSESVFTLLLHDIDIKQAEACAEQLCQAVEACVTDLPEQSIVTTCSIGMALVLASAGTPQSVLSDAHAACQIAIKDGGNQISLYKAVVKTGGASDDNLRNVAKMIETAIEEKRFSLAYQPIVSLRDDSDAIYEVFLRMVDSEGKNVPPGTLFAAAEKAKLSTQLDKWVLKEAARILKQHEKQGKKTHFFIKLSDQAVRDESLLLFIHKLLKAAKISGKYFTIEISEAIAISQIKFAKAFISRLNRIGCETALEHFGTGLNSETTLRHLPVTYVKIDSSYAKGLSSNKEHQDAVRSIVELAHNYKKMTIAESVEDANSLTVLWQCEVDFAQGHYIQEPSGSMDYDFSEE